MTKKEIKEFKKFLRSKGKLRRVRFLCRTKMLRRPLEELMEEVIEARCILFHTPWNTSEVIDYWSQLANEWDEFLTKNK